MKIMATIEARMSSTRLPGKVMLPILGQPMIVRIAERARRSRGVTHVKILTTLNPADAVIEETCRREGIDVFRGSEKDVLDRVIAGTADDNPDVIVQLTGDNPLIDPAIIDETVEFLTAHTLDCAASPKGMLIGLNVRCFTRAALLRSESLCPPVLRAHGGYAITRRPDLFKVADAPADPALLRDDLRLTVDEPADYELARLIFEALYPGNPAFGWRDILDVLERHPAWAGINATVRQKKAGEG